MEAMSTMAGMLVISKVIPNCAAALVASDTVDAGLITTIFVSKTLIDVCK